MSDNAKTDIKDREQRILKLLVDHYIEQGTPVGSRTLSKLPGIDISAASVRNVMGDLEEMGLLKSPHTSAGRVPTSKAYRLFVDSLLEVQEPDSSTLQGLKLALDSGTSHQSLVTAATHHLSGFTRMAGMVTVPRRDGNDIQRIEFVPLSEKRVLAILIINNEDVQNRIIEVERDYNKEELDGFSRFLNDHYLGRPLNEVRDRVHTDLDQTRQDMSDLMELMVDVAGKVFEQGEAAPAEDMVVAGETNLMTHADLGDVQKLHGLFEAFQQKRDIYALLERCVSADGVQIFIGRESGYDALDECSLVTAPYEMNGKVLGVLGVVGPKRMEYAKVIPIVDVTSRLLSAALNGRKTS